MSRKRKLLDYYARKTIRGDDDIMVAGFDFETEGLGGKLLSVQYGVGFMHKVHYKTGPDMLDEFVNYMMEFPTPVIWYAHNSQYEWRYMMDLLADSGLDVQVNMRTDTDVYQIVVKREDGKRIIMRDSFALWNSSLKELAALFCPELGKLELDFDKVTFDPTDPYHIQYAIRDVEILLVALPRLFEKLHQHFGINPNGTFASTSLKGWQLTLPSDTIYNSSEYDEQELYVRQAYYGGLVFLTTTETQYECVTFDINSSYPSVMCDYGVPYGRTIATKNWQDERMGIYHCRVRAPDNLIVPILPARDKKGNMRWYRGEFITTVTNRELIFAANNGYEILEIYSGLVYEEVIYPFNNFIDLCKEIRKLGGAEEKLAKYMQNSLYGKFGSRRERRKVFLYATQNPEEFPQDATPIDDAGKWWMCSELDDEMRAMPQWAVFITAHARLKLLQAVYTVGPENVFNGDTDSITIRKSAAHLMDSGNQYGQWKVEKEWDIFRPIAPKVYSGLLKDGTQKEGDSRYRGAAKGLPRKNLTEQHWKELLEHGHTMANKLSLSSLRVSMKSGNKPAVSLTRNSSNLNKSTNFELLKNGRVRVKLAA